MRFYKLVKFLAILLIFAASVRAEAEVCAVDQDCEGLSRCSAQNLCQDIPLQDFFGWKLAVSTIIIVLASVLAAAGGLGGGGIFVPVFILIMGMSAQQAIPLSQAVIFFGSIVNLYVNYPLKHPKFSDRPLIDFNSLVVMEPMLLAGTIIGVIFNVIFPSWALVSLLAVTLVYATIRTSKKARAVWAQENEFKRIAVELNSAQNLIKTTEENHSERTAPLDVENDSISQIPMEKEEKVVEESNQQKLVDFMIIERKPWRQIIAIIVIWLIVSLFSLFRGGSSSPSIVGIKKCSVGYWILIAFSFISLVFFTLVIGLWLARYNQGKIALGWEPQRGEINWTLRNSLVYPSISMLAGLLGGMLGIGGGMILGPLLLELGMESRATSATSAFAVFVTASSAALQFIVLDSLLLDYAGWFSAFGIVATFTGQYLVSYFVKKYNRASFIVISITTLIGIATIMMTISGIQSVIDDAKNNSLGFSKFC